jgi:hypothetical protein
VLPGEVPTPRFQVLPATKEQPEEAAIDVIFRRKIKERLPRWMRRGYFHPSLSWITFWAEAVRRFYRDGEVFIHIGHDKSDGHVTPRFLEPEDIQHPSGQSTSKSSMFDPKANGIEVDPDDPVTVISYYWKRGDRAETTFTRIPANEMIHLAHSTDSTIKRGLPLLFTARSMLRHFDTWIMQSLKHQRIQTQIAILRSWTNTNLANVQTFLEGKEWRRREITTPAGNQFPYRTVEMLPVIDAPSGMSIQGFTPAGNFGDSEILARRVLLAVASAVCQSEAMVTADGSNANYQSTRITQYIPLRHFEREQSEIGEGAVRPLYEHFLRVEARFGRIPKIKDDAQLDASISPAQLPNFESEVVASTAVGLYSAGLIDEVTAQEMCRLNPKTIAQRKRDKEEELAREQEKAKDALLGDMASMAQVSGQAGVEEPESVEPPEEGEEGEEGEGEEGKVEAVSGRGAGDERIGVGA